MCPVSRENRQRMKTIEKDEIKSYLFELLKKEQAFWSYNTDLISLDNYSDERLVADTIRFLDIDEIKELFKIYTFEFVKKCWRKMLIPEGEYLHTLNRFIAWYFFDIKQPDRYLKSMETRHLNNLIK